MSISKRKVYATSASLLLLLFLGSPPQVHASTTAVVATTPDTVTLSAGYLTIDGGTSFSFPTRQLSGSAYLIPTTASSDSWVTGTAGTAGTSNDQITANSAAGTVTNSDIQAEGSLFNPAIAGAGLTVDGVQVSDYRGSDSGWSLYAYPSDLVSTKNYVMYGSKIQISPSTPQNTALDGTTNFVDATETVSTKTPLLTGTGNGTNPAVQIATTTSSALPTLNATGTNQLPYGSVYLSIPPSVGMADTYNGTITYDLTVAP